ncbi:unnamed protein product [marine sediment metagenome]|uniref:Uncharacterized protein n=1 Tax=marine sediment metagenome TaxID=412755 RepID=X1VGG6_9ZZZZ
MLTTEELVEAIARAVLRASEILALHGPTAAEVYLRLFQLQWNRTRPLPLHTLN